MFLEVSYKCLEGKYLLVHVYFKHMIMAKVSFSCFCTIAEQNVMFNLFYVTQRYVTQVNGRKNTTAVAYPLTSPGHTENKIYFKNFSQEADLALVITLVTILISQQHEVGTCTFLVLVKVCVSKNMQYQFVKFMLNL